MFGFEKIFPRKEEAGMDKAAKDLEVAIKPLSPEEKSILKEVIDRVNAFLKQDYEASL